MAQPSFCSAVRGEQCRRPAADGSCPAPAAAMASTIDALRRASGAARNTLYYQLEGQSSELWDQYQINASATTWEEIAERCRSAGLKPSRAALQAIGYDVRARPRFFARRSQAPDELSPGSAAPNEWVTALENYQFGGQRFADAVDPWVPLAADRLLPPVLSFFAGALAVLLLVVGVLLAAVRLNRPHVEVVVRRAGPGLLDA